jgi:hypothetical protein
LPVFENYRNTENYQDFSWRKHLELFDIANNKQHFKELIIGLMGSHNVSNDILDKRQKVFREFFNDLDGESLNGYVDVITNVSGSSNNLTHGVAR